MFQVVCLVAQLNLEQAISKSNKQDFFKYLSATQKCKQIHETLPSPYTTLQENAMVGENGTLGSSFMKNRGKFEGLLPGNIFFQPS